MIDFTQEKFDIILQAGQSNAEGSGVGLADVPYDPDDRIWAMERNHHSIFLAQERTLCNEIFGNFALPFARMYVDAGYLAEGRRVLVLQAACGGTSFSAGNWTPDGNFYLNMMRMTETALSLNSGNRIVAFLWHQGESDAINGIGHDEHYRNLTRLLSAVRERFNIGDVPFICADFVQHWYEKNADIATPVVSAIRDVCADNENCRFVETDGLLSNAQEHCFDEKHKSDDIHFSRRDLYKLAKRYFDTYEEMR